MSNLLIRLADVLAVKRIDNIAVDLITSLA